MSDILQASFLENNPTQDEGFSSIGVLMVTDAAAGEVEVVMERAGVNVTIPVEIIRASFPKVRKIISAGTTTVGTEIWIAYKS